jgi:hypothetical protein
MENFTEFTITILFALLPIGYMIESITFEQFVVTYLLVMANALLKTLMILKGKEHFLPFTGEESSTNIQEKIGTVSEECCGRE